MGAGSGRIDAVQALRAVAAMSVVVDHVLHEAAALDPGGTIQSWQTAAPWYSGVDVFFVISGFIMVHASRRLFGARDAPWRFLSHRLARIVPLYWAMTGLFVAVAMLDRRALNSDLSGAKQLVANLLFIPWPRPGGGLQPAFSLGWTLNFEMMFYVVFALFIWLPRPRALVCIGAVLAGLVAAHPAVPADWSQWAFWTDPVIAEFGFGMLVAVAAQAGWRLGRGGQAGLAVLAVVLLVGLYTAAPQVNPLLRVGLPVAVLLGAAVLGPAPTIWAPLLRLGDASYALYLVHPFPMRGIALLWRHWHLVGLAASVGDAVVSLAAAVTAAVLIHQWIERPANLAMRRRLDRALVTTG